MGSGVVAKKEIALGLSNDKSDVPSNSDVYTDRIFQICNGSTHNARSNALTIIRNGNTGIGEVLPAVKHHVSHNSTAVYPHLLLEELQNDYVRLSLKNTANNNVWSIAASPNVTAGTALMNFFYQSYGDVLKPFGNGDATLSGALTQNSDRRVKINIAGLKGAMRSLRQLSGYRYQWKDSTRDQKVQIGLLAQEVQAVFPELVFQGDKGILSVNYSGLHPVLIEAAKEQQH